jgi:hypothetical protein
MTLTPGTDSHANEKGAGTAGRQVRAPANLSGPTRPAD